ncbi:proline-specific peptidase [Daedalea quercina L-15889]|uniref:Proline-specific peptidase n=1 Tax=Daedalea quercina L-15889 TaxID=1314783 RepID=A0A165LP83_9APHY|nr:proline-specific peptidase [Daedalea quercina L-15889]
MSNTTGTVNFTINGETYQTWYTVIGELGCGKRLLVTLQGGPGFGYQWMLTHSEIYKIYKAHGIPIVCYDQLRTRRHAHLRNKPKEFWTVQLFVEELANFIEKLGIAGGFDLCGHSWGGMLALSYVVAKQPGGLRRLILTREMLKKHEREGTTDNDEYKKGMGVYFRKHILKADPIPKEALEAMNVLEEDPTVYGIMNGPSEFYITGTLKSWSETLVINGSDDEATDLVVSPLFWRIRKAKWVQFANSSHMAFFEEPERYFEVVGQFLATE